MKAPQFFQQALRRYDFYLHVEWHQHRQKWAVERELRFKRSDVLARMKEHSYRIANRPVRHELEPEQKARAIEAKLKALSNLEAYRRDRVPVVFFRTADRATLQMILEGLRSKDAWAQAERLSVDPVRDAGKAADRMGAVDDYEEDRVKQHQEQALRSDLRYLGHEAWVHATHAAGSRISMARGG